MCKVLHMMLSETGREVSVKMLCKLHDVEDLYKEHFSKRYDFVDFTNKRIYEFDGDQHFKLVEHFHNTYSDYVDNYSSDITKQRIAVELGYDIVRVSGRLTVSEFLDILVRCNLNAGNSLLIRDNVYHLVNTIEMKTEVDQISMLQNQVAELTSENSRLKSLIEEYKLNQSHDEFDIPEESLTSSQTTLNEGDSVSQFMEDVLHFIKYYEKVPMKTLFEGYNEWRKTNNPDGGKFKFRTFSKSVSDYCRMNNIMRYPTISTYTSYDKKQSLASSLRLSSFDSFNERQLSLRFDGFITDDELRQFESEIDSYVNSPLTDKQLQMIRMLSEDLNNTNVRSLFSTYF